MARPRSAISRRRRDRGRQRRSAQRLRVALRTDPQDSPPSGERCGVGDPNGDARGQRPSEGQGQEATEALTLFNPGVLRAQPRPTIVTIVESSGEMYRPGKRRSRLGSGFAALAVFLLVAVANAAETSQTSYGPKVGDRRDHS